MLRAEGIISRSWVLTPQPQSEGSLHPSLMERMGIKFKHTGAFLVPEPGLEPAGLDNQMIECGTFALVRNKHLKFKKSMGFSFPVNYSPGWSEPGIHDSLADNAKRNEESLHNSAGVAQWIKHQPAD